MEERKVKNKKKRSRGGGREEKVGVVGGKNIHKHFTK